MYEPKTLKETIKPLMVVNFVFGMGLTGIEAKKPSKKLEYVYTLCNLVLFYFINKLTLPYYDKYYVISTFELSRFIFQWMFHANIWTITLLIIITRIKAQQLRTIVSLVELSDQKMENIGLSPKHRCLMMYQIKRYIFLGIYTLIFVVLIYHCHYESTTPALIKLCLSILPNIPFIVFGVSTISFCFWVTCLKLKFRQLNELLRSMRIMESPIHKRVLEMTNNFENNRFALYRNEHVRRNTNTIRAVKQIHLEIIKIVSFLNQTFGIQILIQMTVSVVFTTNLLHLLYRVIWLNFTLPELLQELISVIFWILIYGSQILYVNHVCASTNSEAVNIGNIICEFYEPFATKEFQAEIRDFTLQLIQNPVVFTAYGFFNLDHSFIQGVIGTITTYLVVMIQVGDLSNSDKSILS
ncbi:gustatory and pheromone receptor 32a-like [Apis mellifera]|uniref:Gustatory receptor n=1 Tax=Apis mellifera TaxID=7460 RepID=A0A7M7IHC1_APIME|nr:gustatory and pheromone receptor 32a-like [Apis mellifera]|eukprot:XP_016769530.1 gustatory and pheromone receptor 32a-like [Apis mellifera]